MNEPILIPTVGDPVEAIVAVIDLEGFSAYCAKAPDPTFPGEIANALVAIAEYCRNQCGENLGRMVPPPNLRKFTGDGLILIWVIGKRDGMDLGRRVVNLLRDVQKFYSSRSAAWDKIRKSGPPPPSRARVGIARGNVVPLLMEDYPPDYLGYPINLAFRLQKVEPGFVIATSVSERLGDWDEVLLPVLKGSRETSAYIFREDRRRRVA